MIDNYYDIELIDNVLADSIPFPVTLQASTLKQLQRDKKLPANITKPLLVSKFLYSGDEGGFLCWLSFDDRQESDVAIPLTHLTVHRNHPYNKEISRYQKRRIKKLKKASSIH